MKGKRLGMVEVVVGEMVTRIGRSPVDPVDTVDLVAGGVSG